MARDQSEPQAGEKTVTEQLDTLFSPWNRNDAPGLVVGVVKGGAVIYRRGFGMASLETAVANTPRTRMRIGSTTKHFTCLLALLLAEEGKLDIDAPIRTYVPELTGPGGDPSLRQLMQHRGGSRCYLDLGFIGHGMGKPPRGWALAAQARQSGRNFAPGEAMLYNNGGYHLVSIAIERVGGAPFEAQLKARLFDVVGMPDTASIPSDHDITPGIATMHVPARDGAWRRGLFPSDEVRGEGAIVSTIDDMMAWMAHLRRRDRFGSPKSWAALTELPIFPDGSVGNYALGLMRDDYRGLATLHHSGGVMGGTAQMLTLPGEGLDVIVIANGAKDANVVRLAEQVVDIVLADRVGPEAPSVPADDYKTWQGDWWSPETGQVYSLIDEGGALKLSNDKALMSGPLLPGEGGRLISPGSGLGELILTPEAEGAGLLVKFGGETHAYQRVAEDAADAASFAERAQGRYDSVDADATAVIALEADKLVLRCRDGHGEALAALTPLGAKVAFARFRSPAGSTGIVNLTPEGSGFLFNTTRTRHLEFRRA